MRGRLRADFRRFYGSTWPPPGIGAQEAADMVAYLPPDSAVLRHLIPESQQTPELELLRAIEFHLHWLVWAKTTDGSKNRNPPEPERFPWEEDTSNKPDSMSWDETASFLGWEAEMAKYFND